MGVNQFAYSDDIVGYIKLESTFGTAVKPAATDAFRAVELTMGQPKDRQFATDRRGTRSQMERVEGRTPPQPWSASVLFRPSGALGTAPDFNDLLKLVFGTESVTGGTSVAYSFLADPTGIFASIYRDNDNIAEGVYSAICQTLTISWSGDGFITMDFSGVGTNFIDIGTEQANGAGSSSTSLVVDDADFFTKYAIVENITGGDNNGGAGYQITADPNHTSQTLTLESAATWDDDDEWGPYFPGPTFQTAPPIYGTDGSLSLDGGSTAIKHLGGTLTIETGLDLYNREYGDTQAADVVKASRRTVSGNLDFVVKEGETYLDSHARRNIQKDLQIVLGDTAASRMKINCDVCEIDPGQRTSPDTGPVERSLTFVGLGTSGDDECDLLLD